VNLGDCEVQVPEQLPDGFRHACVSIRPELGAQQIGCTVYELPAGERLWPYHGHWNNEEWAIVVGGTPTLRTPEGERELRAGDVVAFAQGEAGAHTFTNRADGPARIAIFSTLRPGTAFYPDSDKIGAGPREDRRYFRRGDAVPYWDGEQA
jgi:uncharacterized cupin superfamily protein